MMKEFRGLHGLMGSRATRGHVSHRIGETLGGSELTIHLIDESTLTDAQTFDRAIQRRIVARLC